MSQEAALKRIERCSSYVTPGLAGHGMYEFWIASEEEVSPESSEPMLEEVDSRLTVYRFHDRPREGEKTGGEDRKGQSRHVHR